MELRDQVCGLGVAKWLRELGIEQKSLFYYTLIDGNHYVVYKNGQLVSHYDYSAFTLSEIITMIGHGFVFKEDIVELRDWFGDDAEREGLYNPDFMAKYLIYLINHEELPVAEFNKRLKGA